MAKPSLIIISTSHEKQERLKRDLKSDFEVLICLSGGEALKALQKKIPAAIVMDHSLEDFLTFQFIDKVRNNPVTRNLPFILVSRESTNSFVEQAVRSGASHYIGVPYEPKVFLEKVKLALRPGEVIPKQTYFKLPVSIDTHLVSYGRISFISSEGIHFETRLKLEPGMELKFRSPLSEALTEQMLSVEVTAVGSDVFYNYPFAVDAKWKDLQVAAKVSEWIRANQHLNSPKKSKVLFVCSDLSLEARYAELIDKSKYSPRFQFTLEEGLKALPFMKPVCVAMDEKSWTEASPALQKKFLKEFSGAWIVSAEVPNKELQAFHSPPDPAAVVKAVQQLLPPKPPEPDRIYFSKALEDSRMKIHFNGKVLVLGELGVNIALEFDVTPPCNFQLDLKTFTAQDFRNPYIRVWPPAKRLSGPEAQGGRFKIALDSHFLGINDHQGQAIRQWLRAEELKEKKKKIADIAPAPKPEKVK